MDNAIQIKVQNLFSVPTSKEKNKRDRQVTLDPSDENLVHECQQGNESAFSELIKRHEGRILNFTRSILGWNEDSKDVAQETFIKAFYAIETFQFKSSFKTWLYRIAANLCTDELRKRKIKRLMKFTSDDMNLLNERVDAEQNPYADLVQQEEKKLIQKAISSLSPPLKMVFVLREMEDQSYEEIAASLNWNIGTVKSRLYRARQEISDKLKRYNQYKR
jgi:RNA polymerase sigma-70 factor (ECF subfamily)